MSSQKFQLWELVKALLLTPSAESLLFVLQRLTRHMGHVSEWQK
jgi:hypothetical protein